MSKQIFAALLFCSLTSTVSADSPRELRIGRAGHAFDHVGTIGEQAEAAASSGSTIIYATGLGTFGYQGLPPEAEFAAQRKLVSDYNRRAKEMGIELSIGYLCATSIVKLDTFDKNWSAEFRAQFKTPPAEWRQQDRQGKPLASWYGGDYNPACMNNPDWRAYERAMVREELETGHDGIFFDNPTIHPQGCYCPHCMDKFAKFFVAAAPKPVGPEAAGDTESIRALADSHTELFLRFRATIARDFLEDMRGYARTINPRALVTCNNSLNTPAVLFSQCRNYGYNIQELSKVEDFVVVEDMRTQPRTDADGTSVEYGPTYKQLHAISHGKPIVAVTLVNDDYHTAPNLMRLAMAEAAAYGASYLAWPTWPEEQRKRMIAAVRPQADLLRRNEELLNDLSQRTDAVLFLPFRRWTETDQCAASTLAAAMTRANIQYKVVGDDDFNLPATSGRRPVLVVESLAVLTPSEKVVVDKFQQEGGNVVSADKSDWLQQLTAAIGSPSVDVNGPPTIRVVVRDQPTRTIVHLLNLNVQRISSFEDKVTPAEDVILTVQVPFQSIGEVRMQTADGNAIPSQLQSTVKPEATGSLVSFKIPRIDTSAIVTIER